METQANGSPSGQTQVPVQSPHPVIEEKAIHERLTNLVRNTPDNDPDHPEDSTAPRPVETAPAEAPAEPQAEEGEIDEETPFFELDYKTDNGVEKKKLSAKEIREGWLAKQDYHRNIQKVKAQEAEVQTRVQQAEMQAAQQFVQQLEMHKQAVAKLAGVKTMPEIEALAKEDPAGAQQEFLRFINVNQTIQSMEAQQRAVLTQIQQRDAAAKEQAKLKARETLEADIPNWNADLYNKILGGVAKDYGFKNEEVTPVVDARLIKVFHDAYQYRQLQQAKPEISKKVVAVPKVVKPGSADKSNPASDAVQSAQSALKKSGDWRDAARLLLARQKQQKR
jgi:hypothetical protein